MAEYIERQAAIDAVTAVYVRTAGYKTRERVWETREAIQKLPASDVAPVVRGKRIEREEKPICRSCNFMRVTSYAKTTGNNRHLKGSRGNCMCKHPDAVKTFNKVCPRSPRMAAFIGYTPPGETKPALKTSPRWCPMRPENKKDGR